MYGFVGNDDVYFEDLDKEFFYLIDLCIFVLVQVMEEGYIIECIYELIKIDLWFLGKFKNIVDYKVKLFVYDKVEDILVDVLCEVKVLGFFDFQIV